MAIKFKYTTSIYQLMSEDQWQHTLPMHQVMPLEIFYKAKVDGIAIILWPIPALLNPIKR